jgi:Flp pilus assembly protein TadD
MANLYSVLAKRGRSVLQRLSSARVRSAPEISVTDLVTQGDAANRQRDWSTAERLYKQALALNPSLREIWVQLGHALKEQGDLAAAEGCYLRAHKFMPDDPDLHLQLGHCYKQLNRMSVAKRWYSTALNLDPNLEGARRELINTFGIYDLPSPSVIEENSANDSIVYDNYIISDFV